MKKMNNKGFSLVELIVVIAIMAVLIGVLAPQFLKFVERGRKSTDVQNVASIVTAIQTYAADPMVTDALTNGKVTLSTTAKTVGTDSNATGNSDKALEAAGIKEIGLKSSKWPLSSGGNATSIDINFTVESDGSVSFTATALAADHDILKGLYK